MKDSTGHEVQDQKIQKAGRASLLAVGRVIPADWEYVRVTKTKHDDNTVWLRIKHLEVSEASA